ncbi:sec-independent protein translocase protein TatA [Desulfohalotomaculum tongense]|uniref:Sec-independent protein translocase subunit TatA/TatB n=1 Tax=Desulforadius tongensis TaxID=1216062 RepID=UPI00195CE917|nr:twin-arginine translocase TatA/TatE family subunit [Desulforadius tongensis]MBM7855349.1 sec-independent protein translocase protein TatA [Desulforadius tongensis]
MFGSGFLQPMHLLLILIVVLIIFGPGKLPDVGKAVGKSIREFKSAAAEKDDNKKEENVVEAKPAKENKNNDAK